MATTQTQAAPDPQERIARLLRDLRTGGLSSREATRRFAQYGRNEITRREGTSQGGERATRRHLQDESDDQSMTVRRAAVDEQSALLDRAVQRDDGDRLLSLARLGRTDRDSGT